MDVSDLAGWLMPAMRRSKERMQMAKLKDDFTARDFARSIVEGTGGMNSFEEHEVVDFGCSDRVAAAEWALRCLANPRCEGSQRVLDEIIRHRNSAT